MQRIALFVPTLDGGGAQRVMVNLANGIARRGFLVDLLTGSGRGPWRRLVSDPVRMVDLGVPRVLAAIPGICSYLRKERPLALISAMGYANVVAALSRQLAGTATKMVCTVHTHPLRNSGEKSGVKKHILLALQKFVYRRVDSVVAVSHGIRDELERGLGIPARKVHVIANPVLEPRVFDLAQEGAGHPWLQRKECPVVLSVGRLSPVKDHVTLLKAFARVAAMRCVRLLILGSGDQLPVLQNLARDLGVARHVDFAGFQENPYAYMAAADVLALTSRCEGLPSVIVEALALGLPIVATAAGQGVVELLDNGRLGFLAPIGDVSAMSEGLLKMLDAGRRPVEADVWRPYLTDEATTAYLNLLGIGA